SDHGSADPPHRGRSDSAECRRPPRRGGQPRHGGAAGDLATGGDAGRAPHAQLAAPLPAERRRHCLGSAKLGGSQHHLPPPNPPPHAPTTTGAAPCPNAFAEAYPQNRDASWRKHAQGSWGMIITVAPPGLARTVRL